MRARARRAFDRRLWSLATLSLVLLVGGGLARSGPWFEEQRLLSNERQAMADLRELGRAETAVAMINLGGFEAPDVLANPAKYPPLVRNAATAGRFLAPRFLASERNGYRFEFTAQTFRGSEAQFMDVKPSFGSFVYVAKPVQAGLTGRRAFAYWSGDGNHVRSRADQATPTLDDPIVLTW